MFRPRQHGSIPDSNLQPARLFLFPAGLLCVVIFLFTDPVFLNDSNEYLSAATGFRETYLTRNPSIDPEVLTKRPMLYPLILLLLGVQGTALFQLVLVFLTVLLIYHLVRVQTKTQALLLLILLLTAVPLWLFSRFLMTETLAAFLVVFTYWAATGNRRTLVALGLLLLVLLKPAFLYLSFFIFLSLLVFGRNHLKRWTLPLLSPYLMILPLMGYNQVRTGVFEYSSIQHINLVDYNLYQWNVNRYGYEKADSLSVAFYEQLKNADYPTRVEARKTMFREALLDDPAGYFLFHARGALRGLADPGRFELAHFFPAFRTGGFLHGSGGSLRAYLNQLGWKVSLLMPLALICLLRFGMALISMLRSGDSFAGLLALSLTLYLPLVSGPINSSRFMMPLLPLLVVFCYKFLVGRILR